MDRDEQLDNELMKTLVGEPVSGICFVMDYVEIHFNGAILRCLSNPIIETSDGPVRFPLSGSRDALCSLIGTIVVEVEVRKRVEIKLKVDSGQEIRVPLDYASREGPEAAHFVPFSGTKTMRIW